VIGGPAEESQDVTQRPQGTVSSPSLKPRGNRRVLSRWLGNFPVCDEPGRMALSSVRGRVLMLQLRIGRLMDLHIGLAYKLHVMP
jgi:hypothetical protein